MKPRTPRWNYEHRLLAALLLAALPAFAALTGVALQLFGATPALLAGLALVALVTLALALTLRARAIFPLRTLANLLEALREGDYSLRGSRAQRGDAVGEVVWEINALAQTLREQRLAVEEKSAQLAKVLAALDLAVFSFDATGCLTLANPAAERLLDRPLGELEGRSAQALGLASFLSGEIADVVEHAFPGGNGRWEIRRAQFRAEGRPHHLLVISDLSRALRAEERLAWQRLLRVLGHELNNSLAPIRSMAETLSQLVLREPLPPDWREDAASALGVIADRTDALARFMGRYTHLARLPPPTRVRVDFAAIARRVVRLEQRMLVTLIEGSEVSLSIDADQIEQALINLIRNAVDAVALSGHVGLDWRQDGSWLQIEIVDDGPGLPPSSNLFVPFFTTKPGGSGIGLVLTRQIIEQHGGTLSLQNRSDSHGCIARIRLPLA